MIANDGALESQVKSAAYYQSSVVSEGQKFDFRNAQLYHFGSFISLVKIAFIIPVQYLELKQIESLQIGLVIRMRKGLYQSLISFVKQAVFMNEIFNSNNTYKGLYRA
jgi:hypothetical protein